MPSANDDQRLNAELRDVIDELARLEFSLAQQQIRLASLTKNYPDQDVHPDGLVRAEVERSKSNARDEIDRLTKACKELRVRAIGIEARMPVDVRPMGRLRLVRR